MPERAFAQRAGTHARTKQSASLDWASRHSKSGSEKKHPTTALPIDVHTDRPTDGQEHAATARPTACTTAPRAAATLAPHYRFNCPAASVVIAMGVCVCACSCFGLLALCCLCPSLCLLACCVGVVLPGAAPAPVTFFVDVLLVNQVDGHVSPLSPLRCGAYRSPAPSFVSATPQHTLHSNPSCHFSHCIPHSRRLSLPLLRFRIRTPSIHLSQDLLIVVFCLALPPFRRTALTRIVFDQPTLFLFFAIHPLRSVFPQSMVSTLDPSLAGLERRRLFDTSVFSSFHISHFFSFLFFFSPSLIASVELFRLPSRRYTHTASHYCLLGSLHHSRLHSLHLRSTYIPQTPPLPLPLPPAPPGRLSSCFMRVNVAPLPDCQLPRFPIASGVCLSACLLACLRAVSRRVGRVSVCRPLPHSTPLHPAPTTPSRFASRHFSPDCFMRGSVVWLL